jgi:hypothetical protein
MLVANYCLAVTTFPAFPNKVKTRIGIWPPAITWRFCKMVDYGAKINILDSRFAALNDTGRVLTMSDVASPTFLLGLKNVLQSTQLATNLGFVMQTTVGISDAAYTMFPFAFASQFETVGWVLNIRKGFNASTGVNDFRKSMKNNPDIALDSYQKLLAAS